MKPKLYVVTGQTATGKTKLAIELAKKQNGELISADSRQLYRYLDVVTGKDLHKPKFHLVKTLPTGARLGYYLLRQTPVWLYDVVLPNQQFSAYNWCLCAKEVLAILQAKQKTPIIVGGSYFYIHGLLYGYSDFSVGPNLRLRQELGRLSVLQLQQRLLQANPERFQRLNFSDRQNPRRLMRQLEKTLTKNKNRSFKGIGHLFVLEILGLKFKNSNRAETKIKERINQRIKQGALAETELLLKMGYNRESPGLETIGYQQLLDYLDGKLNLEEALSLWLRKEKQYAKRQLTLMKQNTTIIWQTL